MDKVRVIEDVTSVVQAPSDTVSIHTDNITVVTDTDDEIRIITEPVTVVVSEDNDTITINTDEVIVAVDTALEIPPSMDEIRDVDVSSPSDGQVLMFDEADGIWQAENIPDVDLSGHLKLDQTIPQQGIGAFDINVKRTRIISVDAAGRGDFTTIKAACNYIATVSPGSTNQWVIQVLPGIYTEEPFTIPTYCLIKGMGQTPTGNVAHCVRITPVTPWLGGTFITVNSLGAIDNCGINATLDAAAISDGIILSGNGRYTRCWIQGTNSTNGVYNLKDFSGGVILQDCNVYVGGSNSTAIYFSDGGAVKQCWIYCPAAGTDIYAIVANGHNDDMNISFVRFGANSGNFFNYDIKCDDGRVHVLHSNYKTYTGDARHIDKWRTTISGLQEAATASDVVSTLKGAVGQTANLLEARNSSDAILFSINAEGVLNGVDPALFTRQIVFGLPGLANVTAWVRIPYNCTILSYELTADVVGNCVIDLWKCSYNNFPPTISETIVGSNKPALSATQKNLDVILVDWTKSLVAGDYLMAKVDSASGLDFVNLTLSVLRS